MSKIYHFTDKIINPNTIRRKIRHSGTEPVSPAHMSSSITTELRGLALQDFEANNFENA